MGRSVSTPHGAIVAYDTFQCDDSDDWDLYMEYIIEKAQRKYKSMEPCDIWLDREDHAVLENTYAWFGLSVYENIVAIWIKVKPDTDARADNWMDVVAPGLQETFGTLKHLGRDSSGISYYGRVI